MFQISCSLILECFSLGKIKACFKQHSCYWGGGALNTDVCECDPSLFLDDPIEAEGELLYVDSCVFNLRHF